MGAEAGNPRRTRHALVRTPLRALYHWGVAPCFRRQFLRGCLYSGGGGGSGSASADSVSPEEPLNCFSKSLAPVWMLCSTSRAASSTVVFILRSSSSSIERLTSALTSFT
jgi:hypothetical protein